MSFVPLEMLIRWEFVVVGKTFETTPSQPPPS